LKAGEAALSAEQYHRLLEAVEQVFEALVLAPKGTDPVATGVASGTTTSASPPWHGSLTHCRRRRTDTRRRS
jgi:hypothetical protein